MNIKCLSNVSLFYIIMQILFNIYNDNGRVHVSVHTRYIFILKLAHYKVFYTCKRYILIIIIHLYMYTHVCTCMRYKRRPKTEKLVRFPDFRIFLLFISISILCTMYTYPHEHFIHFYKCLQLCVDCRGIRTSYTHSTYLYRGSR